MQIHQLKPKNKFKDKKEWAGEERKELFQAEAIKDKNPGPELSLNHWFGTG